MQTIDTTNMCSHLRRKLFDEDGEYHQLWLAMQDDPELTAVVRSRQLHIYRNGKKILVLAGKAAPKVIREDKIECLNALMPECLSADTANKKQSSNQTIKQYQNDYRL